MVLLTYHAKEQIVKRLAKKRCLEIIYEAIWKFLKEAKPIDNERKVFILTNGTKSAVCCKLESELLSLSEISGKILEIEDRYECVFFEGVAQDAKRLVMVATPKEFLDKLNAKRTEKYYFFIRKDKKVLYIGKKKPLLIITFRPARRWERRFLKRLDGYFSNLSSNFFPL